MTTTSAKRRSLVGGTDAQTLLATIRSEPITPNPDNRAMTQSMKKRKQEKIQMQNGLVKKGSMFGLFGGKGHKGSSKGSGGPSAVDRLREEEATTAYRRGSQFMIAKLPDAVRTYVRGNRASVGPLGDGAPHRIELNDRGASGGSGNRPITEASSSIRQSPSETDDSM